MIAIVTDSAACLTEEEASFYGVTVIPMSYTADGRLYREKYVDSCGAWLSCDDCTTYQPSVVDYLGVFSRLASLRYSIICITLSSKMSSAYVHAVSAARRLPDADIRVVNSTLAVSGQYALVRRARLYINSGYSMNEIEARLNEDKKRVKIIFTVDELDTLARSKRIGFARRSVTTALNNKPILVCSAGSIRIERTARAGSDRVRTIADAIPPGVDTVYVNYVDKTPCLVNLRGYLKASRPSLELKLRRIGAVVGINIGRTIIAVSWTE